MRRRHPATERGLHWRGFILKFACWPIFLAGTLLAIGRAEIPYIPTAKEAQRGRFLRLAWPQLALFVLYAATVWRIITERLYQTVEGSLQLSSEAVWGMVGFATLPMVLSVGSIVAAWRSRYPSAGNAWDKVDVTHLGGPA